jgi:hypothetical protein
MKPLLLTLAALAALTAHARAAEFQESFTLREPLGCAWTEELVHRDVKTSGGNVAADNFALFDSEAKAVPVQVEVLEGKPEAVRRARLWFKTTLAAGGEATYRAAWNDAGRKAVRPGGGVLVRRGQDDLIVLGGQFEVMIPAPAKPFAKPVEMKKVPAPILGVRPAGDATFLGSWSLAGTSRAKEIRATVSAAGPIWAAVNLKYLFEDRGQSYEVSLKIVRDEPYIDVSEKFRLPAASRMTAVFQGKRRPAQALLMPWHAEREGRREPVDDLVRLALDERFRPGDAFAVLRPRWTQARAAAQLVLATGLGERAAESDARSRALGAAMIAPGEWLRPYDCFPSARVLENRDGLAIDFPLQEGRRRWALLAGQSQRFDAKSEVQAVLRRIADMPLDRVLNDWVFDWPRNADNPAPHILATWPLVRDLSPDAIARLAPAEAAQAGGGISEAADVFLKRSYQDNAFAPFNLPRRLAPAMLAADLASAGRPAGDARAALLGYVFSDPNYWPGPAGETVPKKDGAGWDAGDPDYNRDMYTPSIYAAAMMPDHPHAKRWAAPALAAFREDLKRAVVMPSGAGTECPAAMAAALSSLADLARTAQNAGLDDPFKWPELRAGLEFLRNLHTPPDPRLGRRNLAPIGDAPPWGDSVGMLFGVAAGGFKPSDPKFAGICRSMYRHYTGDRPGTDSLHELLATDPSITPAPLADAPWTSRALAGFGAVLRSRFGTEREAFAAFKCGQSQSGFHGDELAFHFYGAGMPIAIDWQCGGKFPVEQEHMHNRVNVGDNENMDAVSELAAFESTDAADVAVGQVRSDRLRKMPHYPHDVSPGAAYPRRSLTVPVMYRRYLMLVRHAAGPMEDYLVIRDELSGPEPATFNLFVLARSVKPAGRTFHFDGQLAADAVAFFASPEADRFRLDRWAWPKQDESSMIPAGFRIGEETWRTGELQQWLRVTASPGEAFLVVLYPYRKGAPVPTFESLAGGKGVRVTVSGRSEEVFLSTDPAPDAGGQAVVRRPGPRPDSPRQSAVLLKPGAIPPLGKSAEP